MSYQTITPNKDNGLKECTTCKLYFYSTEENKETRCINCTTHAPSKPVVCDCGGTKVGMPHFRWCSLEEKKVLDEKKRIEGGWNAQFTS